MGVSKAASKAISNIITTNYENSGTVRKIVNELGGPTSISIKYGKNTPLYERGIASFEKKVEGALFDDVTTFMIKGTSGKILIKEGTQKGLNAKLRKLMAFLNVFPEKKAKEINAVTENLEGSRKRIYNLISDYLFMSGKSAEIPAPNNVLAEATSPRTGTVIKTFIDKDKQAKKFIINYGPETGLKKLGFDTLEKTVCKTSNTGKTTTYLRMLDDQGKEIIEPLEEKAFRSKLKMTMEFLKIFPDTKANEMNLSKDVLQKLKKVLNS